MTSDVSFAVVNRTEGVITVGVFLESYAKPSLRMKAWKVFELLRNDRHVVDIPDEEIRRALAGGDAATEAAGPTGPPPADDAGGAGSSEWPREARRVYPQPKETMPVYAFSSDAVVAVIDVELRAAIDSGRYFPSVDEPLAPDRPQPPPPPPSDASFWLAIVRGKFTADGDFVDSEISTRPYEIKPGQTAVITGSEWNGYVWNIHGEQGAP